MNPTVSENLLAAVWSALGTVRDPELDEPVTDLGFVAGLAVRGGVALVRMRLPTYFCAPNFAYLMAADARDAVAAVPGVRRAEVRLEDHFAADEINAGIAAGHDFQASFPGQADDELAHLRRAFLRKAHLAAQDRLCRTALRNGWSDADLTRARLRDAPPGGEVEAVRRRRRELGLPDGPDAPLLVGDDGRPVDPGELTPYLRIARTTRVSIDGNAGFCRGLLRTRYPQQLSRPHQR